MIAMTRPPRAGARLVTPVLVALLAAACGDLYADPVQTLSFSPDFVGGPNIAVDAAASIPRDSVFPCPQVAPTEGTPNCNKAGAACEYGSSPDMRCNTTLSCVPDEDFGSTWTARPSILCPTYQCPTGSTGSIEGTACGFPTTDAGGPADADELVCPMEDGVCACTTGTDALHAHARRWVCVKPTGNCPMTRPLAGQRCSGQGSCDYGSCGFKRGVRMECSSSVWTTGSATCGN
jgi:hypothetical protein